MSRIPLAHAASLALEVVDLLKPACQRIVVAGSVRRRVAEVKDIEIVCEPLIEEVTGADLWGTPQSVDRLMERLSELATNGSLIPRAVEVHRQDGSVEISRRVGQSYQALEYRGAPVDLFIVRPPADWGVILAIRTGPGDWNQRLVTECQRFFRRVQDGRVLHLGKHVPCPEEADFFAALGQPWVNPADRHPNRVKLEQPA